MLVDKTQLGFRHESNRGVGHLRACSHVHTGGSKMSTRVLSHPFPGNFQKTKQWRGSGWEVSNPVRWHPHPPPRNYLTVPMSYHLFIKTDMLQFINLQSEEFKRKKNWTSPAAEGGQLERARQRPPRATDLQKRLPPICSTEKRLAEIHWDKERHFKNCFVLPLVFRGKITEEMSRPIKAMQSKSLISHGGTVRFKKSTARLGHAGH